MEGITAPDVGLLVVDIIAAVPTVVTASSVVEAAVVVEAAAMAEAAVVVGVAVVVVVAAAATAKMRENTEDPGEMTTPVIEDVAGLEVAMGAVVGAVIMTVITTATVIGNAITKMIANVIAIGAVAETEAMVLIALVIERELVAILVFNLSQKGRPRVIKQRHVKMEMH